MSFLGSATVYQIHVYSVSFIYVRGDTVILVGPMAERPYLIATVSYRISMFLLSPPSLPNSTNLFTTNSINKERSFTVHFLYIKLKGHCDERNAHKQQKIVLALIYKNI